MPSHEYEVHRYDRTEENDWMALQKINSLYEIVERHFVLVPNLSWQADGDDMYR
jgi:hypothetical protein